MKPIEIIEARLRELRQDMTWLADKLHISPQATHNWKKRGVPIARLDAIAEALGIDDDVLRGKRDYIAEETGEYKIANLRIIDGGKGKKKSVPLVSNITAGMFEEAIDIHEPGFADDWMPHPMKGGNHLIAFRVDGESMTDPNGGSPSYPHGCIVYIDPEQRSPNHNDCVIAKENGHNAVTFKQFKAGTPPRVEGIHPAYRDIKEEFRILGTLVAAIIYP